MSHLGCLRASGMSGSGAGDRTDGSDCESLEIDGSGSSLVCIVVGASGSVFEQFGTGASTGASGSCCGKGEQFGLWDGMIGGISGE